MRSNRLANLEAPGGFEPPVEILQTSALPLGDGAPLDRIINMEREKGFEPSTSTLARLHSTTELLPRMFMLFGWLIRVQLYFFKRVCQILFLKNFSSVPSISRIMLS
jgi:hypothetical protein